MKNFIVLAALVLGFHGIAQSDISVQASLKCHLPGNLQQKAHNFLFLQKDGIILMQDAQGAFQKFYVDFEEAAYSEDGQYHMLTFGTNEKQRLEEII